MPIYKRPGPEHIYLRSTKGTYRALILAPHRSLKDELDRPMMVNVRGRKTLRARATKLEMRTRAHG